MRPIDADELTGKILSTTFTEKNMWALNLLLGLIDDAPTVGGWISVKDRIPEQQGEYLINTRSIVTIGWFSGTNGWVANDGSFYGDGYVTHWMYFPEPPKENEDGTK